MEVLAASLEKAAYAYHNGLPLLMTDAEFDDGVDKLRAAAPTHPFLTKVGASVAAGDEVALPIPLPSLNKIKDQDAITKWSAKYSVPNYHISIKLDGCSALWLPKTKKLYTRGDGMRGRDISVFVPYFKGLLPSETITAVRGELIMRTDSTAIPAGKLARNIVAGALNRKEADPTLFGEIRFIAYELLEPVAPEEAYKRLRIAGFETARAAIIPSADLHAAKLSQTFSVAESKSPYQMDGIVVAPNMVCAGPEVRKGVAINPADRVAWKTRLTAATARTTVRAVEWNISHQGFLIPRVLFDTVTLAGANIGAATGLHGRWIYENGVGPGAVIEVRRAGDVIPQIIAIHSKVTPAMPAQYAWANGGIGGTTDSEKDCIHITPVGDESATASACIQLTHALGELGAENVGPGIVAKLYAAGFTDLKRIYAASAAELAAKVDGCKEKGADRIYAGLRVKQSSWTELNFLIASCTMPRGVGHSKLTPLLSLNPSPASWVAADLKAKRPAGLSEKTIDAIVDAIPAYLAWKAATGLSVSASAPAVAAVAAAAGQMIVVFTGVRDKALEATLQSKGHIVADAVTKKTTHLVHADGAAATSTKLIKAQEMGIKILSLSDFKHLV